ncbi:hypothetical protein DH2020_039372 [Rehmannia glutinosa]|uniref:Exostosin GT47 domain-containing protein n=1 Tax=Rehmannia glutinosa TaxID=99300 RepID=A0ABR0UX94_REHGL
MTCAILISELLSFVGILTFVLALLHLFAYPYGNYLSFLSHDNVRLVSLSTGSKAFYNSKLANSSDSSLEHTEEPKIKDTDLLKVGSLLRTTDISVVAGNPALRKRGGKAMSITKMNSLLLNSSLEKKSKRPRWSSRGDQALRDAKFQIQNAPIQRNISEVHASLFRNYSMFRRSYELMESTLKVYVYREGEKPIFHLPYLRGIYASEGCSVKLRNELNGSGFGNQKDVEYYLKNYTDIIATKYRFWNRRGGQDHFFVACHDWALRASRKISGNCIRVLCNSNIARGFKIGQDVSLPVTYVRSAENPVKDIGGNPPSNRPILAFFAGGMHGYVRPILLHYWHNIEPDMKIIGPMPRDVEGKARYREFMKSSKYCICAKGYEVHTPRVVESIYYECVPVIISDNYVPPLFDVLNWESFALFILEDDIPNLRDILLSVPEDRYMMMHRRLKIAQRYFLWHKAPQNQSRVTLAVDFTVMYMSSTPKAIQIEGFTK